MKAPVNEPLRGGSFVRGFMGDINISTEKFLEQATLTASLLDWMTVHGNICLGLRHAENQGPSRAYALAMRDRIADLLIQRGILTAEQIEHANAVESDVQRLHRS